MHTIYIIITVLQSTEYLVYLPHTHKYNSIKFIEKIFLKCSRNDWRWRWFKRATRCTYVLIIYDLRIRMYAYYFIMLKTYCVRCINIPLYVYNILLNKNTNCYRNTLLRRQWIYYLCGNVQVIIFSLWKREVCVDTIRRCCCCCC